MLRQAQEWSVSYPATKSPNGCPWHKIHREHQDPGVAFFSHSLSSDCNWIGMSQAPMSQPLSLEKKKKNKRGRGGGDTEHPVFLNRQWESSHFWVVARVLAWKSKVATKGSATASEDVHTCVVLSCLGRSPKVFSFLSKNHSLGLSESLSRSCHTGCPPAILR